MALRSYRYLPRAERIGIEVALPPEAMRARLRQVAADWRKSTLAPDALAVGVSGWTLEESAGHIALLPRPVNGGIPFVIFDGEITSSAAGSRISGVIRLHRGALVALIVIIGMAILMPVGALFEPVPAEDWHQHVLKARTFALFSAAFVAAALALLGFGARRFAGQIRAFLAAAAGPAAASKEVTGAR